MLLRTELPDFYVVNITDEGLPFTGIINMSALVGSFDGASLVYLPRYTTEDDPAFAVFHVYDWLTFLQETLVQSLTGLVSEPPPGAGR